MNSNLTPMDHEKIKLEYELTPAHSEQELRILLDQVTELARDFVIPRERILISLPELENEDFVTAPISGLKIMITSSIVQNNPLEFRFSVFKGGETTVGSILALVVDAAAGIPDDLVEQLIRRAGLSWVTQEGKMISLSMRLSQDELINRVLEFREKKKNSSIIPDIIYSSTVDYLTNRKTEN